MSSFEVSTDLHVEHRQPSAGDAQHESPFKVQRRQFWCLGFCFLGCVGVLVSRCLVSSVLNSGFDRLGIRFLGFKEKGLGFWVQGLGFAQGPARTGCMACSHKK